MKSPSPFLTPTRHQRSLPVPVFDQYDAAAKSGGQYELARVDWNCLASPIAFGFRKCIFGARSGGKHRWQNRQAGQIHIGGEEADRARAATHPKQPAAKARETSSGRSCGRIVGRWSWYLSTSEVVISKDGSAGHSASGSTGKWTCAGNIVRVVWSSGRRRWRGRSRGQRIDRAMGDPARRRRCLE